MTENVQPVGKITMLSPDRIKPYPGNPRKNDQAVTAVMNSIKSFGFLQPIVVDKEYTIIVGHARYKAAKKLGLSLVPVIVEEELTPQQARAYRIADNSCSDIARWDIDLLNMEMELISLDGLFDMVDYGFTDNVSTDTAKQKQENKYAVVVECQEESEQKTVFELLENEGYKPRCLLI